MILLSHWVLVALAPTGSGSGASALRAYPATYLAPILASPPVAMASTPIFVPFVFDVELASWLEAQLDVGIYPLKIPQEVTDYPVLTYTLVDADSETGLSGPNGLRWRNYQFDAYSPDYAAAATLSEQLTTVLEGYRGPMGRAWIQVAQMHRNLADYETPPDGSDDGIYRLMSEFTLWYRRPRSAS